METAVSSRDALSVIESHFRFLVDEFDFALTQSADIPATAWYQAGPADDRHLVRRLPRARVRRGP